MTLCEYGQTDDWFFARTWFRGPGRVPILNPIDGRILTVLTFLPGPGALLCRAWPLGQGRTVYRGVGLRDGAGDAFFALLTFAEPALSRPRS